MTLWTRASNSTVVITSKTTGILTLLPIAPSSAQTRPSIGIDGAKVSPSDFADTLPSVATCETGGAYGVAVDSFNNFSI
jgi:hypothetical protein